MFSESSLLAQFYLCDKHWSNSAALNNGMTIDLLYMESLLSCFIVFRLVGGVLFVGISLADSRGKMLVSARCLLNEWLSEPFRFRSYG